MLKNSIKTFVWIVASLVITPVFSQQETEEKNDFDMGYMIMHHISDAHEFPVFKDVSVYLPIILLDDGLQVFSSKKFYKEGEEIDGYLVNKEVGYGMYHEKIYKLNGEGKLDFDEEGHVASTRPLDFSITKNVFGLMVAALAMVIIFITTARSYRGEGRAPKGIAKFTEPLVLFVRDEIAIGNIGEKKYKKYMPYLLTVFFFIWINAIFGLIPFFPGSTNVTGNISFTLMLAIFTLILTVFSGTKHYWGHIFATPGVPKPLLFIMIPIEIVGIFTKPFALTVRLFANMTAGHIIILAFIGIIFTFQSVAWAGLSVPMALFINFLELLVGALQAFIFTMLSALFIGEAVAEH
ncbi:MAG: F0F1 ATP synthase subunit A [Brumimicrobium sp.]